MEALVIATLAGGVVIAALDLIKRRRSRQRIARRLDAISDMGLGRRLRAIREMGDR